MFCKNCGNQIDENAYVCIHCGVRISDALKHVGEPERFCSNCGKQISPDAYICVGCGKRTGFVQDSVTKKAKSFLSYAIACLILSAITLTLIGAIVGIVGTSKALLAGNKKGIKINFIALCVCAVISLLLVI